jgi:hypothetical protein
VTCHRDSLYRPYWEDGAVRLLSIDFSVYRAAYTDAIALVNRYLIGEKS